jgi:uncharacterized protein
MSSDINQFNESKYINLETYRKSGKAVITPVWFVFERENFFVITRSGTGKVKRLRNNPNVRISPCSFRGQVKGKWIEGIASFVDPIEFPRIISLRNKKYGIQSKIISLFTVGKGKFIIVSIKTV